MFGSNYTTRNGRKFQDENTSFLPQSPYATAKLAAHRMVQIYREAYELYSCAGILYNHEGPRRGENFVTRKITQYIGRLESNMLGDEDKLHLGNLEANRDWGHSKDFVRAMWLILQQDKPQDFVIGTSETHTVREFLEKAFLSVHKNYLDHIVIDQELYRPCEVDYLCANYSKAKELLGWTPQISFDELVTEMVHNDIMSHAPVLACEWPVLFGKSGVMENGACTF
jgi:GDPmannose 4,6-dehydratase